MRYLASLRRSMAASSTGTGDSYPSSMLGGRLVVIVDRTMWDGTGPCCSSPIDPVESERGSLSVESSARDSRMVLKDLSSLEDVTGDGSLGAGSGSWSSHGPT